MDTNFKVGPQTLADGANAVGRITKTGDQAVSDAHGRYQEATLRGNVFTASNVAAQAVSVALTTTYTGLCLSNPAGNTKNLVLLAGQYAITVAEAAIASQHLIAGYSSAGIVTHTTPLASPGIQSAIINGSSNSTAKVDSAATIVNPYYLMPIRAGFTAAALGGPGMGSWVDFGGLFVIPPGGWVAWGALTAITGFGGFAWEEVPI